MSASTEFPQLEWTGERMIPGASDAATELYHWQRYLYFRPWYENARVIDAASGEGYGTNYASHYAQSATGFDLAADAVKHATDRYPNVQFAQQDVTTADYSDADLVVSFETIEHVPDPRAFLQSLRSCSGRIVISTPNRNTHSPGNTLEDKPFNQFHTIEWTPTEFAELVQSVFPDRQVRFVSQESQWPGLLKEGLDPNAMYCIAVIGDGVLPQWPKIGLSMPTVNNPELVQDAVVNLTRYYPGELHVTIVANGSSPETVATLQKLRDAMPYCVTLIESPVNLGYGQGSNLGLADLQSKHCDIYGVTNDDILNSVECLTELVLAYNSLRENGQNPGLVAPVTNNIHGAQRVEIGSFSDLASLANRSERFHHAHHSEVTQQHQIRGMFFLMAPECLNAVGGFDPRFAVGNYEDDDLNLRCRLAGYTLWVANGAFMFHHGSMSFRDAGADVYNALIERNGDIFRNKWDLWNLDEWPQIDEVPEGVNLHVPLDATYEMEYPVNVNGFEIDLISQASDIEFVNWVFDRVKARPRDFRREIVACVHMRIDAEARENAA